VAVGLGDSPDAEGLRRAAGVAVRALAGSARVALALPAGSADEAGAVATGALLGNYSYLRYRTGNDHKAPVQEITVLTGDGAADAVRRAEVLAESVTLVRDLVNTPPSDLNPEAFAEVAERVAADSKLDIEVLDETALVERGYGGIAGVGQGSINPPRLVRLAYSHPEATKTVAFVGKGITFDTGGLSLKPADAMDWMKSDMGGAAAVLGALKAVAKLQPKVNVIGYLPMAENMPSGTAQRPSDVISIYGGRTVEVLNTDAEGRLILADALVRAAEDEPDLVVDVATLTGAQLVALGTRTAGVMANDDDVREKVVAAAERAGEAAWPMPLPEELRKGLDSSVADIANISSDRWGGMLTAGVFLKEFVPEGLRWAHLDIAGPSFHKGEPYGYTPKGGTGAATRTLVQIAEDVAAGTL
jgi:leucyl aminopeptidase